MKKSLMLAAMLAAAAFSQAATITQDLSGAASWDGYGSLNNNEFLLNIGANSIVTGVSWTLNIETVGGSWLSEAIIDFDNSASNSTNWFAINAGFVDEDPGTGNYTSGGIINLADANDEELFTNGGNLQVSADGILKVELYESFNDFSNAIDANYLAGSTITVEYTPEAVPEPATMAILGLGVAALARRKRK